MTTDESINLIKAISPIVAAIASVMSVFLGRTIHKLVNSAMTAVKTDLALANERITALQTLVSALSTQPPTGERRALNVPAELMVPPATAPTVAK